MEKDMLIKSCVGGRRNKEGTVIFTSPKTLQKEEGGAKNLFQGGKKREKGKQLGRRKKT